MLLWNNLIWTEVIIRKKFTVVQYMTFISLFFETFVKKHKYIFIKIDYFP